VSAELLNVFFSDGIRLSRKLNRIFQHGRIGGRDPERGSFGGERIYKRRVASEAEQTCSVMADSVVAVIGRRDGHGNHFTLRTAKLPGRVHRSFVNFQMSREDMRSKAVNLENIGQGARLTLLRFINGSQLTLGLSFLDRSYPCHWFSPVIHLPSLLMPFRKN